MSSSSTSRIIVAGLLIVYLWSGSLYYANGCYPSIISFGDSLADTGNRKHMASVSDIGFPCVPPYGQDFVGQSTGRCSNGRLIIDFLAESLGLPLIPPYFHNNGSGGVGVGRQGVNYAVEGATAMGLSSPETKSNIELPFINASLEVQLAWFKQSLPSICGNTTSDCRSFIERSLILMGEIGGNDYNNPFITGKSIDEVEPIVPLVIDTIVSAINELIEMGARTLVVPGNFPIGCFPWYLTTFVSHKEDYDPITGCITKLNEFMEYHNNMLQTELNHIRELNPNVIIIYADYYNALMQIYLSPDEYGFQNGTSKACCGCGGPFNFDPSMTCGDRCKSVCDKPDTYVSWDGIHLTERAYKLLFKSLFQGSFTTPKFNSVCPRLTSRAAVGLSSSI